MALQANTQLAASTRISYQARTEEEYRLSKDQRLNLPCLSGNIACKELSIEKCCR